MAFDRHGYRFEGAFRNPGELQASPGVYVIWCRTGDSWKPIDVGEAEDVRARVLSHDRKDCWNRNCSAEIWFAAHYTAGMTEAARREVENRLRILENPPCGLQ